MDLYLTETSMVVSIQMYLKGGWGRGGVAKQSDPPCTWKRSMRPRRDG